MPLPTESIGSCTSMTGSIASFASITDPALLLSTEIPCSDNKFKEPLTTTYTGCQVRHKVLNPRDSSCFPDIPPPNQIDNAIPTCKQKPRNSRKKNSFTTQISPTKQDQENANLHIRGRLVLHRQQIVKEHD